MKNWKGRTNSLAIMVACIAVLLLAMGCQDTQTEVVESIGIKALPDKTAYYIGEHLDLMGLEITTAMNTGTGKTVVYADDSGITLSPEDGEALTTAGAQEVTVNYKGFKANFEVNVRKSAVRSATIKTNPADTVYITGEEFDPTGLVATVTMNDGTSSDIAWSASDSNFTFSSAGPLRYRGTQDIKVLYQGVDSGDVSLDVSTLLIAGTLKESSKYYPMLWDSGNNDYDSLYTVGGYYTGGLALATDSKGNQYLSASLRKPVGSSGTTMGFYKNGVWVPLSPDDAYLNIARGMVLYDPDDPGVYIIGNNDSGSGPNARACYWTTADSSRTTHYLESSLESYGNVAVLDGNILYIGGSKKDSSTAPLQAGFWRVNLTDNSVSDFIKVGTGDKASSVADMLIDGNTIYMSGTQNDGSNDIPGYWKYSISGQSSTFQALQLTANYVKGVAQSMLLFEGGLYFGGYQTTTNGVTSPCYWRGPANSSESTSILLGQLDDAFTASAGVKKLLITSDGDLYKVGGGYGRSAYKAVFWDSKDVAHAMTDSLISNTSNAIGAVLLK